MGVSWFTSTIRGSSSMAEAWAAVRPRAFWGWAWEEAASEEALPAPREEADGVLPAWGREAAEAAGAA